MKPLKDLDLLDRFLFDNVMEDPEICRDVLSICIGEDIPPLVQTQKEKVLELTTGLRAIRLDVFSMDENDRVYNAEMQGKNTKNLQKRSRYYQAHLDASLLEPGEVDFNKLNDSYMIMIMPFDLFGQGKYRYTFRYQCEEDNNIYLEDGAVKIFLNTRGTNPEEVSEELVNFLKYVEDSSSLPTNGTQDERLMKIHNKVRQIKDSEEKGVRYMQEWEERVMIKQEGELLGKAQSVSSIIKEMHISLERACEIVGISIKDYEMVMEQK